MSRVVDVAVRHPRVRVASAPVVAVVHALDRMRSYRCPRGALSIAFLGDRDGIFNVWSVRPDGSDAKAHTAWKDFDVRSASITGPQMVVARGADLHRVSLLADGPQQPAALPIVLLSDHAAAHTPRWLF